MLLHIGSDALIALSYFAIPFGIARFVKGRHDLEPKHRALALLFAAFITLCGFTHIASIVMLWYPYYVSEGWLKGLTGVVSAATAVFALSLIPQLLRLPSAKALQREVDSHRSTLSELDDMRAALARRIAITEGELRQAEQNHAASDKLLRGVVEAVPGLIFAKDIKGRMILANKSALELFGKPWSQVQGRCDTELIADRHIAEAIMAADASVMALNQQRELEVRLKHPTKGHRVFLSTKCPLRETSGEVSGIVGMAIDITEQKQEQTEARVAIEQALEQKTKALGQRDVLLREVYHRVKNNLQIIDSFLVMQARISRDSASQDAFNSLRGRVHALGLVHHQLMASNDFATFDIAPFLQELVGHIADAGATADITLSVVADPMAVGLDLAIPLGLVVTELVTNAVKHAFPSGQGNIDVSLTHDEDNEILLIVRDDGRGIASAAAESAGAGPGLGTDILIGLIRQLQGTMVVRDEGGTTVEVRIKKGELS